MARKPTMSATVKKVRLAAKKSTEQLGESSAQLEFELVKFRSEDAEIELNFDISSETIWATQHQMAKLFGCSVQNVAQHLATIYEDGELDREATIKKILKVAKEGERTVRRGIEHYNLDVILSVGYRVSSSKATAFRQWATKTLRSYLVDGYVLNEKRLSKDTKALQNLAAEVRRLRSDETQIYASVRECFKVSASDYDPSAEETRRFYSTLQDKFLYAACEMTAPQIVLGRADGKQPNMGLQSMKGKMPTVKEAQIGKNYLQRDELYTLHILCEQFLLYAESKAIRGQKMTMKSLLTKLDTLLEMNEYPVFPGYKNRLKDIAMDHARLELERYRERVRTGEQGVIEAPKAPKKLPNRRPV